MDLCEQCREIGQLEPCSGDGGGGKRQDITTPVRLKFLVVGNDTGQMDDGRMKSKFAGILRTQLAADGLFKLHRHFPRSDELSTYFSKITSNVGLLHLGQ